MRAGGHFRGKVSISLNPPGLTGGYYLQRCVDRLENQILYDWVSITSKIHSTDGFIQLLGMQKEGISWEVFKGAPGYQDRLYYNGISIHYNGREDMGIWLEMSGQGCRTFESHGSGCYEDLFAEVLMDPEQVHLTRLDIAFDDHTDVLDIDQICEDTEEQEYVSRFKGWQVVRSDGGNSVTLGSRSSEILIRIYDKAAERGYDDGRHWVRCELQLRRDRALAYVNQQGSAGEVFKGVLLNYLRYVEADGFDTNKWRWPLKPYWDNLCGSAQRIQLYTKPGVEYNMLNLENFVFEQAGNAIATYQTIYGVEKFQERLKQRGTQLNAKYTKLIRDTQALQSGEACSFVRALQTTKSTK